MGSVEDALISIRPNYAEAILAGEKTVELRRRIPAINLGTRLWIYATRPLGAIVGSAVVDNIIDGTPAEVWDKCIGRIAIDRLEYDKYFFWNGSGLGTFAV